MKTIIRNYEVKDWEIVQKFIKLYWNKNSPMIDHSLFEWQHKGYGDLGGSSTTQLLFYDDELIGFLGSTPVMFQIPRKDKTKIISGIESATWVIHPDFRNRGGGILLLKKTMELRDCLVAQGANDEAVRYFKGLGFDYSEALNRYVIPLDRDRYLKLLSQKPKPNELQTWFDSIDLKSVPSLRPFNPNPWRLEYLWRRSTEKRDMLTLYRSSDFWSWRYIKNKGFKYYFLGDTSTRGIVVARVEPIFHPKDSLLHGLKVLRIIEMVPFNWKVWDGMIDAKFVDLIKGVLKWGKSQGCVAADFQCSTKKFEPLLKDIGFKKQNNNYGPPLCSLAGLFQPFQFKPHLINTLWRVHSHDTSIHVPIDDTYILKSDGDMDRPNIWPMPENLG